MSEESIPTPPTLRFPDSDFGPWTLDLGLPKNWPTPCCHPTMVDANPHLRRLSPQDWEFLFRETLLFAHYQVQRLRWRGAYGGVMPDGFDPNSLAAHSISATAKICLREAVDRLVQFYEATERPGEAALWKQKLLEFDRER